jgi:hypothetical protein
MPWELGGKPRLPFSFSGASRGLEPASSADRIGRMSATLWSAKARSRAAEADGVIAEAQAVESPLRHHRNNKRRFDSAPESPFFVETANGIIIPRIRTSACSGNSWVARCLEVRTTITHASSRRRGRGIERNRMAALVRNTASSNGV